MEGSQPRKVTAAGAQVFSPAGATRLGGRPAKPRCIRLGQFGFLTVPFAYLFEMDVRRTALDVTLALGTSVLLALLVV
jgi:hypothetical protein